MPPFCFNPPPKLAPFHGTAPHLKPVQCISWCINLLHHHHMHGAFPSCYHLPASSGFHYRLVSARMCVSRGHLNPNPAGLKPRSQDRTPRCSSVGALHSVTLPGHGPSPCNRQRRWFITWILVISSIKESCITPCLELFRLLRLWAIVAGTPLQMVIIGSYDSILTK